jgi:hypothetical protein
MHDWKQHAVFCGTTATHTSSPPEPCDANTPLMFVKLDAVRITSLVRRLCRSPVLLPAALRYAMVGEELRGEPNGDGPTRVA